MSKTEELKKVLTNLFKEVVDEVHYEIVDDDASYPHLCYELREVLFESGKTTLDLEVNILDRGTETTKVETLADLIQEKLKKYYFINETIQFSSYISTRNTVQEEDKKIRRRRLTFEIQLHELKEE